LSTNTLTEANTLERSRLELKHKTRGLDVHERARRSILLPGYPIRDLSPGAKAATSPEFLDLAIKVAKTSEKAQLSLDGDVPLAHLDNGNEAKALITGLSDTSAGSFVTNKSGDYVPQPRRRLRVLDLVRLGETDVDAVEFARQTSFTNVAVEVAEATSSTTGTKPEATVAFEKVTAAVKNYATWVPATRRALSDVDEARNVIDGQLSYACQRALEEAVVTAMVADAGATQAKGADALPVAVLKLLTTLRNADVEPTAALLNPLDYETIRTLSGTSPYLSGPPITVDGDGTERLFGIPLIVTPSVPDDTALVADMQAVGVWLRSAQIYLSASHASYFTANLVAILAELRAAHGVLFPAGVGKVTGGD
jgi:HK97 family phage major capsid protein